MKTQNSITKGRVLISVCDRSSDTSGEKILITERKELLMTLARFIGLVLSPPSIFLSVDSGSARVDVIPPRVFTSFHQFQGLQLLRCSTLDL